jgi:ABC-type phosphate/phosphonate transport system substrate-binding protein
LFLPEISQAIVLGNGEYAVIANDGYTIGGVADGKPREQKSVAIQWQSEAIPADQLATP